MRAEERVHYACDQMFDNAQISMTIKGVSCASPRVTSAKIGEKKSALILETHTYTHCQTNTPTRLPVYPLTRSLLTLNLKFTARHSYIRRRQQRNREPKRDTEREREVAAANAFAYLVWCLGLGLNALGPVHWRLVRCCKPEFLLNDICISSIYFYLSGRISRLVL